MSLENFLRSFKLLQLGINRAFEKRCKSFSNIVKKALKKTDF